MPSNSTRARANSSLRSHHPSPNININNNNETENPIANPHAEISDEETINEYQNSITAKYISEDTLHILVLILGWYGFSLSISIYNKWMFGPDLKFQFPIIITSFHQFCLFWLSFGVLFYYPQFRPILGTGDVGVGGKYMFIENLKMSVILYIKHIIPCSLTSASDIGLSNFSFKFISLSLYTMIKTSSLIFVLVFSLLFKLEKFNWRLVFIVLIMTISVMMMSKSNTSATNTQKVAGENKPFGILLVLSASVMSGLRWSFTQILLKKNSYTSNPISTIFYISPAMCLVLVFSGMIIEGFEEFFSSPIWQEKGIFGTLVLMIIPGILAFMMTICEFQLLKKSKVITLSVAGIFKELLTIIFSTIIFKDQLSIVNFIGLMITFGDIVWYNVYRYRENGKGEEYVAVADEERDVELQDI